MLDSDAFDAFGDLERRGKLFSRKRYSPSGSGKRTPRERQSNLPSKERKKALFVSTP